MHATAQSVLFVRKWWSEWCRMVAQNGMRRLRNDAAAGGEKWSRLVSWETGTSAHRSERNSNGGTPTLLMERQSWMHLEEM